MASLRLLEFNRDAGGANPRRVAGGTPATTPATRFDARTTAPGKTTSLRPFPVKGNNVLKPARRNPVDLEALQTRIHALEQRIQQHSGRIERHAAVADLEGLQLRMKRLEQSLNSELWAARQREHTMLELLSKPPLKTALGERLRHAWQSDMPALLGWVQRAARQWWLDTQPGWWPRVAAAWQESLDQARR